MWENLVELYNMLSTNSIAVAVILTPLISGISYLLLKAAPGFLYSSIRGTISTTVTILQATDEGAFQVGEYLLSKYKFYSLFNFLLLRTPLFTNNLVLTVGSGGYFWSIVDGMIVVAERYPDGNSKMVHKFVLSFTFFTRNKKKINDLFRRLEQEKETTTISNEICICIPNYWGNDFNYMCKEKVYTRPRTESQKHALDRIVSYVRKDNFKKLGVMLYGQPGTGKSKLIETLASVIGYKIYYIDPSIISSTNLSDVFGCIRTPAIILIEDIDYCTLTVDQSGEKFKEGKANLSLFLNILDGIRSLDRQIVIATTNHYDRLNPALKRKGRFDITVELKPMKHFEIVEYVSDYFEVSRSVVSDELGEEIELPVANVSAACNEAVGYRHAVKLMLEDR